MRIVGGEFRGRKLFEPRSNDIRPTTDRVRESLFNILSHQQPQALKNARVLDIFAGTGALGFEALSRGAQFVQFVETSADGCALISKNAGALGVGEKINLLRRDATRPGNTGAENPFDLVFADPPYSKQLGEKAIVALRENGWLTSNALIVFEERKEALVSHIQGFEAVDRRSFGDTAVGLFRVVNSAS